MLIDRLIAKNKFNEYIETQENWIYIIGKSGIGKSYFIRSVTKYYKTLYCEPNHYEYWREMLKKISQYSNDIIKDLIKDNSIELPKGKKLSVLTAEDKKQLLEDAISQEIHSNRVHISKYLGSYLSNKYTFIVLDNLYKCDSISFNWMISLLDVFCEKQGNLVVAICDNDKRWLLKGLEEDFLTRISRINIEKFDDYKAFAELINTSIHFDNEEILENLAKTLYKDFDGKAESILYLLSFIKKSAYLKRQSDQEKLLFIKDKAAHIMPGIINSLDYLAQEILAVLSISPVALTAKGLAYIIDEQEDNIHFEINVCLQNDYIERQFNKTNNSTIYYLSDLLSKELYINRFKNNHINYFYEKLYRAYYLGLISMDKYMLLKIAIKCNADNIEEIARLCFTEKGLNGQDKQKYAKSLNDYLSCTDSSPSFICIMNNVNLLYDYGYYQSAYRIICNIKDNSYIYLMKKGDIEHLLLHPNTAYTFEKAAQVKNISISQKLSAINRQIMALTQEKKADLVFARTFYKRIISEYQNEECDGLIELYRNSNNIFDYSEAIEYTIKGYNLAVKLNNNFEKIKSLHNICMLKLLNGSYYDGLNHPDLNVEPNFKMICKEFETQEEFLHELSYPLLDLGTLEMFEFVKNTGKNINNLLSARKYYSRAQLYARSYYAKNIAAMALLIVNSYLYREDTEYVISARNRIFQKYLKEKSDIKDFRIHRKILLSLATSASITNHLKEGQKYLLMAKSYVFDNETLRFNNLCEDLGIAKEKIIFVSKNPSKIREYHTNSKFVPWLISFGH